MSQKLSPAVWTLAPILTLGPAVTCVAPRSMAVIYAVFGLATVIADMWQRRARPGFDASFLAIMGLLMAYGAASQWWSINPEDTFPKALTLGAMFTLTALLIPVVGRMNGAEYRRLGLFLATGLGAGAAVYFFERFAGYPLYEGVRGGFSSDVIDIRQNKPAVLLALWLYMLFPFFIPDATSRARAFFVIMVPVVFLATMWSKSASAQLIIMGMPAFVLVLRYLPARAVRVLALACCTLIMLGMPLLAMKVYENTNWEKTGLINDSVKSRIEIWNQAASRAAERPIFGWGLDSAPKLPNRDDVSFKDNARIAHLHPHNGPLQIWFEMGLAGVAGFIALFVMLYRRTGLVSRTIAQKYGVFMWSAIFLYTLSIWGIWQSWFVATLCLTGLMAYAGVRRLDGPAALEATPPADQG